MHYEAPHPTAGGGTVPQVASPSHAHPHAHPHPHPLPSPLTLHPLTFAWQERGVGADFQSNLVQLHRDAHRNLGTEISPRLRASIASLADIVVHRRRLAALAHFAALAEYSVDSARPESSATGVLAWA